MEEPQKRVQAMDEKYLNGEESQKIIQSCEELIKALHLYEKEKIDTWCSRVRKSFESCDCATMVIGAFDIF